MFSQALWAWVHFPAVVVVLGALLAFRVGHGVAGFELSGEQVGGASQRLEFFADMEVS